jgi:hypothetical protein
VDCSKLGNIVSIGQAATLLCQYWPTARFGDFPIDNSKALYDLVIEGSEVWIKVKELAKEQEADSDFCWKRSQSREYLHVSGEPGRCKRCRVVEDWSDCSMVAYGKCYADCPEGMKPMRVIGRFAPVCTSDCRASSSHDTGCVFGCATSYRTCAGTLMDQVGFVAKSVGKVAAYMANDPEDINNVIDKVFRLVTFLVDAMTQTIAAAKQVWDKWSQGKAELSVIVALFQEVLEHAKRTGKSLKELESKFGETLDMIMELLDAGFEWKEVNLKFVADTILQHGRSILDSAYEFTEVFSFPNCQ